MILMKDITREGNPVLRKKCVDVKIPLSKEDEQTLKDMIEYIVNSQNDELAEKYGLRPGVGLAAPQIGVDKKMLVILSYDENGNLIEERYNPNNPRNEFVITYEYNEFGQKIYENQYSYEAWYTYNSKGLLEKCTVNKFDSSEDEGDEIYEYDENGNLIHFKNWDVNLEFEYEFFPSGNIKRKITRKVE